MMLDVSHLILNHIGNIVSFRYSFASEEYLEYVNSVYNDIFAFFISGPYDEDDNLITSDSSYYYQYNIAKIPGTQYPVCINNVNHITYPEYFRLNENDNCKMDGYTVELETEPINIVPNGRYKMELAISDIGDSWNNSAVYLTANSFSFSTDLTDTICQGETYTMNGFSATETGVYTLNFETVNGFDSIVTLNLIVNPSYDFLIIDTICEGYDYMDYNLNIINPSDGVHNKIQNLSTIYGCDSIVRLNLTVNPSYDTLIIDTICEGYDYMDYNFNIINPSAGVHNKTQNLSTIYGCDSIVRLNLIVNPTYDITITESICEGDDYTENGFIFENKPAGNYFDTLFLNTVLGCDSIVRLNLTVHPTYDTLIIDTICEGYDYMDYNFNIINPSDGVHNKIQNLSTIYGCDSIVRLNLTVNPSYDTLIIDTICEGYDYMDYNFNIINPSAGVHNKTQNLSTIYGCDSIVRLNLIVNPTYDITITESICEGDDYTENGFIFENKPAGNYFDTLFLNTVLGCDSIVKLQLTINKTYRFDIYDSICEGDDYNMYGLNIINPNVGIYEYMSNLHTTNGCDSIYNIDLKVINKYEDIVIEGIEEISVATNLSTGCYKYTIGEVENHEHYTWEIDNEEWKIIPDNNECIVCATTPDKGTLYVRAENYCGSVYDYIVLNAKFIEDQDNADVRIYPNPITDFVNIQQNDITCINVYDSFGQIVIGNNYNFDNQVTLDLSNLRSSIYIIEIITLEQTFVERIYIKK